MSALPQSLDVATPRVEVTRPAWLDGVMRGALIAGMCCLVLLVPGEADRLGSGDVGHRS